MILYSIKLFVLNLIQYCMINNTVNCYIHIPISVPWMLTYHKVIYLAFLAVRWRYEMELLLLHVI